MTSASLLWAPDFLRQNREQNDRAAVSSGAHNEATTRLLSILIILKAIYTSVREVLHIRSRNSVDSAHPLARDRSRKGWHSAELIVVT